VIFAVLILYTAMPDALSKTVPIWCAVMNRILFPQSTTAHELHTPPNCVSQSEDSQIKKRLEYFVNEIRDLQLDFSSILAKLDKPLRPIWITRDSLLPNEMPQFTDFSPVVLCTASRKVAGAEMSGAGYIQGAGDDSESWSHGLTPTIFWAHKATLLNTPESDLPTTIPNLIQLHRIGVEEEKGDFVLIRPTPQLFVGPTKGLADLELKNDDLVITCSTRANSRMEINLKARYLHLQCRPHKLGSRDLRTEMVKLPAFIAEHKTFGSVYVCCETGADLSAGIALSLLCLYYDSNGGLLEPQAKVDLGLPHTSSRTISKIYIRQRLSWIMTTMPYATPSRTTLQSVNDFLFSHS
jgi:tRNA A64-2'-O-ribosylphosphate transferase